MRLKSDPAGTVSGSDFTFYPNSVVKRNEVRDSGAIHSKAVRAEFVANAGPFVVPKGDAVQKEWRCHLNGTATIEPGEYVATVAGRFLRRGLTDHEFQSVPIGLSLTAEDLAIARDRIMRDGAGKYMYSNHVRIDLNPLRQ